MLSWEGFLPPRAAPVLSSVVAVMVGSPRLLLPPMGLGGPDVPAAPDYVDRGGWARPGQDLCFGRCHVVQVGTRANWGSDGEFWGQDSEHPLACTYPGGSGSPERLGPETPRVEPPETPGAAGVSLPEPLGSPLLPNHHVSFVVFSAKCCFECFLEKKL